MNEVTNKKSSVFGNSCLIILLLLLTLVLQILCGVIFSMVAGGIEAMRLTAEGIVDAAQIEAAVYTYIMDHSVWSVVLYHVTGLLVFGLIYWKMSKTMPHTAGCGCFNAKAILGIVLVGIGMEFFVSAGVEAASYLIPEVIQNFEQQMETAGINTLTLGSVLATMILAPIGEELLCRGIIFRLAQRISPRFLIANSIQALAFGIMHFNLVQGVYAFVLGFVLGMLYQRFQSLYAPILCHCVVNTSAMLLVPLLPEAWSQTIFIVLLIVAISLLIAVAGGRMIGTAPEVEADIPIEL